MITTLNVAVVSSRHADYDLNVTFVSFCRSPLYSFIIQNTQPLHINCYPAFAQPSIICPSLFAFFVHSLFCIPALIIVSIAKLTVRFCLLNFTSTLLLRSFDVFCIKFSDSTLGLVACFEIASRFFRLEPTVLTCTVSIGEACEWSVDVGRGWCVLGLRKYSQPSRLRRTCLISYNYQ